MTNITGGRQADGSAGRTEARPTPGNKGSRSKESSAGVSSPSPSVAHKGRRTLTLPGVLKHLPMCLYETDTIQVRDLKIPTL